MTTLTEFRNSFRSGKKSSTLTSLVPLVLCRQVCSSNCPLTERKNTNWFHICSEQLTFHRVKIFFLPAYQLIHQLTRFKDDENPHQNIVAGGFSCSVGPLSQ
ncbi:unnamed protein product [Pleuronectes platessa]|uniref:Uncharacterized protein n=1 Tax=Pleuronectes platessa TaxID=8262 RepID=A0A9N7U1U7_PLEPL|nr:unnamed protein product [Pleuronectes platessa]